MMNGGGHVRILAGSSLESEINGGSIIVIALYDVPCRYAIETKPVFSSNLTYMYFKMGENTFYYRTKNMPTVLFKCEFKIYLYNIYFIKNNKNLYPEISTLLW